MADKSMLDLLVEQAEPEAAAAVPAPQKPEPTTSGSMLDSMVDASAPEGPGLLERAGSAIKGLFTNPAPEIPDISAEMPPVVGTQPQVPTSAIQPPGTETPEAPIVPEPVKAQGIRTLKNVIYGIDHSYLAQLAQATDDLVEKATGVVGFKPGTRRRELQAREYEKLAIEDPSTMADRITAGLASAGVDTPLFVMSGAGANAALARYGMEGARWLEILRRGLTFGSAMAAPKAAVKTLEGKPVEAVTEGGKEFVTGAAAGLVGGVLPGGTVPREALKLLAETGALATVGNAWQGREWTWKELTELGVPMLVLSLALRYATGGKLSPAEIKGLKAEPLSPEAQRAVDMMTGKIPVEGAKIEGLTEPTAGKQPLTPEMMDKAVDALNRSDFQALRALEEKLGRPFDRGENDAIADLMSQRRNAGQLPPPGAAPTEQVPGAPRRPMQPFKGPERIADIREPGGVATEVPQEAPTLPERPVEPGKPGRLTPGITDLPIVPTKAPTGRVVPAVGAELGEVTAGATPEEGAPTPGFAPPAPPEPTAPETPAAPAGPAPRWTPSEEDTTRAQALEEYAPDLTQVSRLVEQAQKTGQPIADVIMEAAGKSVRGVSETNRALAMSMSGLDVNGQQEVLNNYLRMAEIEKGTTGPEKSTGAQIAFGARQVQGLKEEAKNAGAKTAQEAPGQGPSRPAPAEGAEAAQPGPEGGASGTGVRGQAAVRTEQKATRQRPKGRHEKPAHLPQGAIEEAGGAGGRQPARPHGAGVSAPAAEHPKLGGATVEKPGISKPGGVSAERGRHPGAVEHVAEAEKPAAEKAPAIAAKPAEKPKEGTTVPEKGAPNAKPAETAEEKSSRERVAKAARLAVERLRAAKKVKAEAVEEPVKGAKPAAREKLRPDVISPLSTVGRALAHDHKTYEPWADAMREMVPEVSDPYLKHVWDLVKPSAPAEKEPVAKVEVKEKPHGVTRGETEGRPETAGAGPERRNRPEPEPGGTGGEPGGGRGPRKRGIVVAREEHTRRVEVTRTPEALREHLSEEQQQASEMAISAMQDRGAFLLADGTGVGKTRVIMAVSNYFSQTNPVLIVAPAEFLKLQGGKPTGSYADDGKVMGIAPILWKENMPFEVGKIYLATYHSFQKVTPNANLVVVFDEAHKLKNEGKSKTADAGIRIGQMAKSVLYSTATPADKPTHIIYLKRLGILEGKEPERALRDLGMIQKEIKLRILVNGEYKTIPKKVWAEDGSLGRDVIVRRFGDLFDRMTAQGVMVKREVSMEGVDVAFRQVPLPADAYDTMQRIEEAFGGLEMQQGLRKAQILMHQRRQQEPYKIPIVAEITKKELEAGRQVILFVSRVNYSEVALKTKDSLTGEILREVIHASEGTAGLLKEALEAEGIDSITELHGDADIKGPEAVRQFQSGEKKVMIATVESGGMGINLDDRVGDSPRTLIMVTAPFSGVDNVQAAGRVNRRTTMSDSKIIYLHTDSGPDIWNLGIIAEKMKLLGATVKGQVQRLEKEKARAEAREVPVYQPSEIDEPRYQKMVEDAGGIYRGIQRVPRQETRIAYDEPTSKSTTWTRLSDMSPETVSAELARIAEAFRRQPPAAADVEGFMELAPDKLEAPEEKVRRGVGAHGLGREYLVKVPWRVKAGTKSKVVQSTMPQTAEKQETAVRDVLARHPNALTSKKAWHQMQFDAFGDNLLPIEPIQAIRYVERPDRLAQSLLSMSDKMIADTREGLEGARALGEAYRSGTATPHTTALMVLWSILSRQKSPYFHEAAFIDAVKAGVEDHIDAALEGRFDTEYLNNTYLPWADGAFPDGSPGKASSVNLNSYGRDFLFRMGTRVNQLHELLSGPASSQEFAYGFWRLAPAAVGIDDKLLKFMSLIAGKFDALVLDRVQINHLFGAGQGGRPQHLYDQPGLVALIHHHRGLLIGGALEIGLDRIMPQTFAQVEKKLKEAGRPALGIEPSVGAFHWLTWNLESGQEATHGTLEGIKRYALGDTTPFQGVFSLQGKFNTFKAGARYGYLREEPTVLYTGPNGQPLAFTPEQFEQAIQEARRPRAGVLPRGFTFGQEAQSPFWQRPGVDSAAWQRILDEFGVAAGEGATRPAPAPAEERPAERAVAEARETPLRKRWTPRARPEGAERERLDGQLQAELERLRQAAVAMVPVEQRGEYRTLQGLNYVAIPGLTLDAHIDNAGEIFLDLITVPKSQQGKGVGTMMMDGLLAWADDHNLQISLDQAPDKGKKSALRKFYREFGFRRNGASFYDPTAGGAWVRPSVSERPRAPIRAEAFETGPGYGLGWISPTGDDTHQEETGASTHLALARQIPGMKYPDNRTPEGYLLDEGWIRWRKSPYSLNLEMESLPALRRAKYWLDENAADQPVNLDLHNPNPTETEEYYYSHHFADPQGAIRWINEVLGGKRRVSQGPKVHADEIEVPVGLESDPAFQAWFGDSKVVDYDERPRVVYHGTTFDFDRFSPERGNPENAMGRGFYFTSSSYDANRNYAGEGPDLTSRIEFLAEKLKSESDEEEQPYGSPGYRDQWTRFKEEARAQLAGEGANVMPVFLRIEKPFLMGKDTDESEVPYSKLVGAIRRVAERSYPDADINEVINALENYFGDDVPAGVISKAFAGSQNLLDLTDDEGQVLSNELFRDVVKALGFDGVIMKRVDDRFPRMDLNEEDEHYVVWKPSQVKSAIGNTGAYSRRNPNILMEPEAPVAVEPAPMWYSRTERALQEKVPNQALPAQVQAILKGPGLRAEDVKNSGMPQWLSSLPQNQKITKDQVLEAFKRNRITVTEELLGPPPVVTEAPATPKAKNAERERLKKVLQTKWDAVNDALTAAAKAGVLKPTEGQTRGLYEYKENKPGLFTNKGDSPTVYRGELVEDDGRKTDYKMSRFVEVKLASPLISLSSFDVTYELPGALRSKVVRTINAGGNDFKFKHDSPEAEAVKAAWNDLKQTQNEFMATYSQARTPARRRGREEGGAVYSKYTLPGGKYYRELLFHAEFPEAPVSNLDEAQEAVREFQAQMREKHGGAWSADNLVRLSQAEKDEYSRVLLAQSDAREKEAKAKRGEYTAPHFHGHNKNLLAHMRFTERIAVVDGKPYRDLNIEEFQSDWIQQIRKAGGPRLSGPEFDAAKVEHARLDAEIEKLNADLVVLRETPNPQRAALGSEAAARAYDAEVDPLRTQILALREKRDELEVRMNSSPPEAPLMKGWEEMLVRRTLRWAAENGFDYVSWTTGVQQAKRYNLSNFVQEIKWAKNEKGYTISAGHVMEQDIGKGRLEELLGREIANKIEAGEGSTPETVNELASDGWTTKTQTPRTVEEIDREMDALHERGDIVADPVLFAEHQRLTQERNAARDSRGSYDQVGILRGVALDTGAGPMEAFYNRKLVNVTNDILKPWGVRAGPLQVTVAATAEDEKVFTGVDHSFGQLVMKVKEFGGRFKFQDMAGAGLELNVERDEGKIKRQNERIELGVQRVEAERQNYDAATDATTRANYLANLTRLEARLVDLREHLEGYLGELNTSRLALAAHSKTMADQPYKKGDIVPYHKVTMDLVKDKFLEVDWHDETTPENYEMRQPLEELIVKLADGRTYADAMTEINQEAARVRRRRSWHRASSVENRKKVKLLTKHLGGRYALPKPEFKVGPTEEMFGYKVTPEMKKSVMEEGQPLMEPEAPVRRGRAEELAAPETAVARTRQQPRPVNARELMEKLQKGVEVSAVLGDIAVSAVPKNPTPKGIRLMGLGVMRNMIEQGRVNFKGLQVDNARDLALISQVIRNPIYETAWRFYMNGNEIVGVQAVTSETPGTTAMGEGEQEQWLQGMREEMQALGADGYYLLHNHPDGNPRPSPADEDAARMMARRVPGYKGSVIIDSGKYSVLDRNGYAQTGTLAMEEDPLLTPSVPHKLLASSIVWERDAVKIGMELRQPGIAVMYRASTGKVRALETYMPNDVTDEAAFIAHVNDRVYKYGATTVWFYSDHDSPEIRAMAKRVSAGVPRGTGFVIGVPTAESATAFAQAFPKTRVGAPRAWPRGGADTAIKVQQEEVPVQPEDREHTEEEIVADMTEVGRFLLDDGAEDFETWKNRMVDMIGESEILPYLDQVWKSVSGTEIPTADIAPQIMAPAARMVGSAFGIKQNPQRVDLVRKLQEGIGIPVRVGRMGQPKKVLGIFKVQPEVIRTQTAYDLQTLAHEAGHWFSKVVWGDPVGLANRGRATFYGRHRAELMTLAQGHAKPSEEEGFAEFWRLWMTRRADALANAPRLSAEAPGLLQTADPDMAAAIDAWSSQYESWLSQDPFDRIKSHIVWDVEKKRTGTKAALQRFYEDVVYEMAPVDRATRDLMERAGVTHLEPDKNPAVLMQTVAGMPQVTALWLFKSAGRGGALDFETRKKVGPSLEEVLEPVSGDLDNFQAYMVGRRMVEIMERTDDRARRQWTALSRALELTREQVIEAIRRRETPAFKKAADGFRDWNDAMLRYVRDSGLMTQQAFERVQELNRNYVPFYRFFYEENAQAPAAAPGGTFGNVGSPVKGMKGSGRPFQNPLGTAVKNLYTYVMRAERHRIAKAFVTLAEKTPGGGGWLERIPVPKAVTSVRLGEIRTTLEAAGVPGAVLDQADLEQIALLFRPDWFKTAENEFWVLGKGGKPVHYQVEPTLYKALMLSDRSQEIYLDRMARATLPISLLAKALTGVKHTVTSGATLTLEFATRNPLRDVIMRAIFSEAPSKLPLPILGPMYDIVDSIIGTARGIKSAARKDEWFDAMRRGGGMIEGLASFDGQEMQKQLDDVLKGRDKLGWRTIRGPFSFMKFLSNTSELATRIAETKAVLQARGVTPATATLEDLLAAGQAARDVSGDWHRVGSAIRALGLNRLIAFYNPQIIGLDKFGRTFFGQGMSGEGGGTGGGGGRGRGGRGGGGGWREEGGFFQQSFGRGSGQGRILRLLHAVISTITAVSVLLWILNHDDPRWDKIPVWQKNIAWIWLSGRVTRAEWDRMTPTQRDALMRRTIWRIPKPFELGVVFGTIPERILDWMVNKNASLAEELGALGGAMGATLLFPIPSALMPFIENMMNWSFFYNRKIEPGMLDEVEPIERTNLGVTGVAEKFAGAADALNNAIKKGLGLHAETNVVPEMFRSPLQVDHLIYGLFAGQGHSSAQLIDKAVQAFDPNAPPAPAMSPADIPGLRAFTVRYPTTSAEPLQEFYRIYSRAQQISRTASQLKKTQKNFLDYSYAPDHRVEAMAYPMLQDRAKVLSTLRANQRYVLLSKTMTPVEKRERLDELTLQMIGIAEQTVSFYRDIEERVR